MTKAQLEAFLDDAGVAHAPAADREPNAVDFKNRGVAMRAIGYERGDLLHLTCSRRMPSPEPPPARVAAVFQAIEDEFPIVKLSGFECDGDAGFTVAAEQFQADQPHLAEVFWKTADLLVAAADECGRRLAAPAAETEAEAGDAAERERWTAQLEAALLAGSPGHVASAAHGKRAGVFERVKAALALVLTEDGSTGTAFCIGADEAGSYFLTNAHVAGDAQMLPLYRQYPDFAKHEAAIVARKHTDGVDLALLHVAAPGLAHLHVDARHPKPEGAVALAGYARVHIWAAEQFGELVPSLRRGSITGVLRRGACVLHDVLCRPGDSGAPLFDPATGAVVGVQTGGWADEEEGYAIGASVVAEFLAAEAVR